MIIPISKPDFTEAEYNIVSEPLKSGWVVQGKYVNEFENLWSKFTGADYSIAVSSCTTALHLSLIACGIKDGDEVIIPSFTWVATANAVEYCNAKPVFCDINLSTYNIDTEKICNLITPKTKAIIPVHLFGFPAEIDIIKTIAHENNLLIIEDAACGFGSYYRGKHVGSFGKCGCFSFHPRKSITTGEGGMITTNDKEINDHIRALRNHGASDNSNTNLLPEFKYLGYNYRMTDIQASIGLSQLRRADTILNKRKKLAKLFDNFLEKIDWLIPVNNLEGNINGYQSYVCLFMGNQISKNSFEKISSFRNHFMNFLLKNGISSRPGTHAVHNLNYYREKYGYTYDHCINSYIAEQCSVALPFYTGMEEKEIEYLFKIISRYYPENLV